MSMKSSNIWGFLVLSVQAAVGEYVQREVYANLPNSIEGI